MENVLSEFEDFRRRMNNKMFFLRGKTPGNYVRDKSFRIKSMWNCEKEYKDVNDFCYTARDKMNDLFQNTMGMKRSQKHVQQRKNSIEKVTSQQKCQGSY